jgi:uncharacterized membrane protein
LLFYVLLYVSACADEQFFHLFYRFFIVLKYNMRPGFRRIRKKTGVGLRNIVVAVSIVNFLNL